MLSILALTSTTKILIGVAAMILLIIVGSIIALWVRRSYHDAALDSAPHETLSLHDLRRLHAQGGISDEEFEALKAAILQTHTASEQAPPVGPPAGPKARPGCDLTGDPLPDAPDSGDGQAGDDHPGKNHSGPVADPP